VAVRRRGHCRGLNLATSVKPVTKGKKDVGGEGKDGAGKEEPSKVWENPTGGVVAEASAAK